MSHELRTPLTAMTAVTDVLGENAGLTGDAAAAARLVRQEIRHLNRLVDDLIEISRFDAGAARLVADETGIAAAIRGCLRARGWENVPASAPADLTALLVGADSTSSSPTSSATRSAMAGRRSR